MSSRKNFPSKRLQRLAGAYARMAETIGEHVGQKTEYANSGRFTRDIIQLKKHLRELSPNFKFHDNIQTPEPVAV